MKHNELQLPSNKKFGIFFSLVFLVFCLYFFYIENYYFLSLFFCLSLIFIFLSFFFSFFLLPINKAWMYLGYLIGKIVSPIVLGFIFFLIIFPTGFLRRVFGNDELKLKTNQKNTFWINKKNNNDQINFKNQF